MTVDYVAIGARVKAERIRSHITQEKLAEKVGMSPAAISKIERGLTLPSLDNFIGIVNALGISADEILDQVAQLHEKTGMTVVLVSHSMEDVAKYVDRLIVMNQGEKMLDGTPQEVFRHYKELEAVGLAAPQVTYVMHDLKEKGFEVSADAATVEEAADEIMKCLKQTRKAEREVQA